MANVKTQGGKSSVLHVSNKNQTSGEKVSRYLSSRFGTIKLKKGETVYLYFYFATGAGGMKLFNLKIK